MVTASLPQIVAGQPAEETPVAILCETDEPEVALLPEPTFGIGKLNCAPGIHPLD